MDEVRIETTFRFPACPGHQLITIEFYDRRQAKRCSCGEWEWEEYDEAKDFRASMGEQWDVRGMIAWQDHVGVPDELRLFRKQGGNTRMERGPDEPERTLSFASGRYTPKGWGDNPRPRKKAKR